MTDGIPVHRAMEGITSEHLDLVGQRLRETASRPSLVDDIESIARHLAGKPCSCSPAAERVLAASRAPGGLAGVLLGQSADLLESRLVTFLRVETERLVRGD